MPRSAVFAALLVGASVLAPTFASADDSVTLTAAGSTALLPLVKAAGEAYHDAHADVTINAQGGGSGTGLAQVAAKSVDIGDSDIPADKSKYPDLVDHKVCVIGFAIVANPNIGVKNVTHDQIVKIFTGQIKNWKEVGGADQNIVVVNRPRNSGTRTVFLKTVMGSAASQLTEQGLTEDATGQVVNIVKSTAGAISYAALSGTRGQGLTELTIDGVGPTDDNIEDGKWPDWSYEHMYTNGPPSTQVSRFLAFVQSNSTLIHSQGYLLFRDMKVPVDPSR